MVVECMRKLIFAMTLLTTVGVQAEQVSVTATGVYKLGEFDRISSGKAMAEQIALEHAAGQMQKQNLSISKLDKNGFFTRASWLFNSAQVRLEKVSETVGECAGKNTLCATATVKASFDASLATSLVKKIYNDKRLVSRIEMALKKDKFLEDHLLDGDQIDIATLKSLQEKRKELIDYLSNRAVGNTLGRVDANVTRKVFAQQQNHEISAVKVKDDLLEFKQLMTALKNELKISLLSQKVNTLSDGTVSITVLMHVESDGTEPALKWVAEKLGLPEGAYENYRDKRSNFRSRLDDNGHRVPDFAYFIPIKKGDDFADESGRYKLAVTVGQDDFTRPKNYMISYGLDGKSGFDYIDKNKSTYWLLDHKKTAFMKKLINEKICVNFFANNKKFDEKCLAYGGKNTDQNFSTAWDKTQPFFAFPGSGDFWVTYDLTKSQLNDDEYLRKLEFRYEVDYKSSI